MSTTAEILFGHDPERHHRDRLAHLNERLERAHGDEGREMIQRLVDQENERYQQQQSQRKKS